MKALVATKPILLTLLATALLVPASAAQGGGQVPFKGHFVGDAMTGDLSGQATQLGAFTGIAQVVPGPTGFTGTFTWTAPNGDSVTGTFQATFTSPPPVLNWNGSATITGGTGRFEGATGGYAGPGTTNLLTNTVSATFQGLISAVGLN